MTAEWPAGEAAFVTGAASGIGLGIARALVAAGAKVALADIDADRLAQVAKELTEAGGTVTAVRLDVTDPDAWPVAADAAEAALGPISILCNNAGVSGEGLLEHTTLDLWRWVNKINVEAQFIGVSTFLPRFRAHGKRAHIVNVASMAGLVPMVFVGAYVASKFASVGFSSVLRDELQGSGIGVSVLCPGAVASNISANSAQAREQALGEKVDPAVVEGNSALLAQGADPLRVGEQVLEAIRAGQFLIITHRDWQPLVSKVHAEVQAAFDEFDDRHGSDPTALMLAAGPSPLKG